MKLSKKILAEIKQRVIQAEPDAKIVLYGSYARGDANEESDIDLLILINKDTISHSERKKISYPLYDLGIDSGWLISALIQTKKNWQEKFYYTPLYHAIQNEGIEI